MKIEFNCVNCGTMLKAPKEYAGKSAVCKNCNTKIRIPQAEEVVGNVPHALPRAITSPKSVFHEQLRISNFPITIFRKSLEQLTEKEAKELADWGNYMFRLGSCNEGLIEEVKYEGNIVLLDDGSKWEVDSSDTFISDSWGPGDHVVVIDDVMYRLDDTESVNVSED